MKGWWYAQGTKSSYNRRSLDARSLAETRRPTQARAAVLVSIAASANGGLCGAAIPGAHSGKERHALQIWTAHAWARDEAAAHRDPTSVEEKIDELVNREPAIAIRVRRNEICHHRLHRLPRRTPEARAAEHPGHETLSTTRSSGGGMPHTARTRRGVNACKRVRLGAGGPSEPPVAWPRPWSSLVP